MYTVYILQSREKNHFYIGVTGDIITRLKFHNSGRVRSTKAYMPWLIIYTEVFEDKKSAYTREYYLKHPKGYLEKRSLIEKHRINNPI